MGDIFLTGDFLGVDCFFKGDALLTGDFLGEDFFLGDSDFSSCNWVLLFGSHLLPRGDEALGVITCWVTLSIKFKEICCVGSRESRSYNRLCSCLTKVSFEPAVSLSRLLRRLLNFLCDEFDSLKGLLPSWISSLAGVARSRRLMAGEARQVLKLSSLEILGAFSGVLGAFSGVLGAGFSALSMLSLVFSGVCSVVAIWSDLGSLVSSRELVGLVDGQ